MEGITTQSVRLCDLSLLPRCSILACLAYVTLGLGDPVSALAYSRQLLNTPQLPGGLHYLGKLYSAEALVFLERVTEAMQLLNPDSIGDVSLIGGHYLGPMCCIDQNPIRACCRGV